MVKWTLAGVVAVFGLAFFGLGIERLLGGNGFGWVMITFGGVSLLFAYQDARNFRGRNRIINFGLTTHLQRMVGSYIASVTAFVVTNVDFLLSVVAWLAPKAVLVPLIVLWSRRWKVVRGA